MNSQAQREHAQLMKERELNHPKLASAAEARRKAEAIKDNQVADLSLESELDRLMRGFV